MDCVICGRHGDADRETGYNADAVCPPCAELGWYVDASGQICREVEDVIEIAGALPCSGVAEAFAHMLNRKKPLDEEDEPCPF
jgi:hypothetical protein